MLASRASLLPWPLARGGGPTATAFPQVAVSIVGAVGALLVFAILLAPAPAPRSAAPTALADAGFVADPSPLSATDEPPPPTATDEPPTATEAPVAAATATDAASPTPQSTPTPQPPTPVATPTVAASPTRAIAPARPGAGVPILMYHYIRANPDPKDQIGYGLSIPPDVFAQQMAFLDERGYRAVPMRALNDYVGTGKLPGEKWVVLTFEDGYRDAYTAAWPVLKKHGFAATFYVITDLIDNPRYLTRDQIKEMAASGMEIGDHSASHSELPALGRAQLQREIVDSKAVLERILGGPVVSFCYPSGHNNLAVRQAVQAAGYVSAVTVDPGTFHGKEDPFRIPRVRVYGGIPLAQFARALGEPPPG